MLPHTDFPTNCNHRCSPDNLYHSMNKIYMEINRLGRHFRWDSVLLGRHSHSSCCIENQFDTIGIWLPIGNQGKEICILYRFHCCCRTGWDTSLHTSGCTEEGHLYSSYSSSHLYRLSRVIGMPYTTYCYSCMFRRDMPPDKPVDTGTSKAHSSNRHFVRHS